MTPRHEETILLRTRELIDDSLRNHLCFLALRTENGKAFHLGTLVRTMFASYYLLEAGYGVGETEIFTDADEIFTSIAVRTPLDAPFTLHADAVLPTAKLLELYDKQLQIAPVLSLVHAHQKVKMNLGAAPHEQLSIAALIQRAKANARVGESSLINLLANEGRSR